MPDFALHPPVHLTAHPDEPIRSTEAAARVIRRHSDGRREPAAADLADRLERASSSEAASLLIGEFVDWAQRKKLLLIPPEDRS